jgi:hypothetical protein
LIFWVLVALLKGEITLQSMCGAGLELLVTAIRSTIALLFLLVFVIVGAMIAVSANIPLVILTMILLKASAATAVTHVTLFCNAT